MTDDEREILDTLSWSYPLAYHFAALAARTGLTVEKVRIACHNLRAQGYAECFHGLFDEDGQIYGSGYAITPEGISLIKDTSPE